VAGDGTVVAKLWPVNGVRQVKMSSIEFCLSVKRKSLLESSQQVCEFKNMATHDIKNEFR